MGLFKDGGVSLNNQPQDAVKGDRRGRREREITSTIRATRVSVPHARLQDGEGNSKRQLLPPTPPHLVEGGAGQCRLP